jgi:hypothetical protein
LRWNVGRLLDDLAEIEPSAFLAVIETRIAIMSRLQWLVLSCTVAFASRGAIAGEKIDLTPADDAGQLTHVTLQIEAGGHNLVRAQQEQSTTPKDNKAAGNEQKQPTSVAAKLAYDEKRLTGSAGRSATGAPLSIRYYDQVEAVIKVNETGRTPQLPDDKRTIIIEQGPQRPMAYCPDGTLSREQLDLVDVVGDSICINRLLPKQPVAEGESWANDASVMGPLLTFDTVAACEVQCVLDEFNGNYAKIKLSGDVQGTADGAATQQEVRGVFLFDRRLHRVVRLNLAIREKRSIGGATPGLDITAKVQVKIDPLEKSAHLSDDIISKATSANRTPLRDLLFESAALGFRVNHDRQWYVTAERREAITFRRVDGGDLVAQCTVTALPPKSAGRQTSLEQFQKDITFSLGKSFGELVSSRQFQNAAGLYCYEVVARGIVEEVPVEWHYYLLAPESGNRVSVVVTIEKPMLERVGRTDQELIESLELFPPTPATKTAEKPTKKTAK